MKTEKMFIRIDFTEDILGSLPADKDILTRFISHKANAPWLEAEEGDCLPEKTDDSNHTVFPQDHLGMFLWNYHLKGFIKEAGNNLKDHVNVKNLRSKMDNFLFVHDRRLYLYRGKDIIQDADSILERPLRAQTARGPRVSLVGSERVSTPVTIYSTLELLYHKELNFELVKDLLTYGKLKGLGQWRNASWGTFDWAEVQEKDMPKTPKPKQVKAQAQ